MKKWHLLVDENNPALNGYINRVIQSIETAYKVLSNPEARARYDLLNQSGMATPLPDISVPPAMLREANKANKSSSKSASLLLMLCLMMGGAGYYWFDDISSLIKPIQKPPAISVEETPVETIDITQEVGEVVPAPSDEEPPVVSIDDTVLEANEQTLPTEEIELIPSVPMQPVDDTVSTVAESVTPMDESLMLEQELQSAQLLKQHNAHNPELRLMAIDIAEVANKNINTVINDNAKFIGAKASNQNITYRFIVIDGVTVSKNLLSAFLMERYMIDSNGVCNYMRSQVEAGILMTYAYYNTKGELVGSFYIDEQVCLSPTNSRLVKTPDANQLNSMETDEQTESSVVAESLTVN